jgi:hypothetical protein
MKKVITILAIAAFMFAVDANAQEPKQTKKVASTETKKACCATDKKETASAEKKSCGTDAKGGSCCAAKKAEAKKEN